MTVQAAGPHLPGDLHSRADGEDPRRVVTNRPACLAIGIDCDGLKQVMGLWVGRRPTSPAKFWLSVLSELKSHGIVDVCVVCIDGLTSLFDLISVVWLQPAVQLCVVYLIRASHVPAVVRQRAHACSGRG
jgi:transposase-like protein